MDDSYEQGSRMAWSLMLQECCRQLGYNDVESDKCKWIAEREAAISSLRNVCQEHGDNTWPVDLHLADIIEKHLHRHLP